MLRTLTAWFTGPAARQRGEQADPAVEARRSIRSRTARDLPACARLLRVVASEHQYPDRWPDAPRSWLAGPDVLEAWVSERQGEILGHVAIGPVPRNSMSRVRWREITGQDTPELGRVSRLFVRRRVRGQGIGSALLDVAVAELRAQGLTPVTDVVSSSTDGIALLEHRGWRLLAMDPWGSNSDQHRMHFYIAPPPSER